MTCVVCGRRVVPVLAANAQERLADDFKQAQLLVNDPLLPPMPALYEAKNLTNQALRREIGVVFQAQSIDLKLTAAENLRHQGHLYGLHGTALSRRIKEILERVGLADRARDKAETFSGGMQRRLELASDHGADAQLS